jgi:four helix bundle protein
MNLNDLEVYRLAMEIGEKIWNFVAEWDYFAKDTLGKQIVRAADSISSNISEAYGRYHFKDKLNFLYYSRGSLFETKTWIVKAKNRKLISLEQFSEISLEFKQLSIKLNNYITITKKQLQ